MVQVHLPLPCGSFVKRLRHRPFTAGSRVRIPYESPDEKTHQQKFLLVCFLFYITMLFYLSLNRIEISKHKYKEYSCRYFIAFIKSKNYLQLKFKKLIILYLSHNLKSFMKLFYMGKLCIINGTS